MTQIVGIRFKKAGKLYYFSPQDIAFEKNDGVIVETARGIEFGKVAIPNKEVSDEEIVQPLKPVIRKATEDDIKQQQANDERKPEALRIALEKIKAHKLNMKLIDVEFTFDFTKVIFYFASEGRVDFRELVKDMASVFKMRIELRQIGIRDESKAIGGLGPCGRPCCCNNHMGEFERVSIKMANVQGLSLNPAKISGLCGRLMCCLAYENENYAKLYKLMPKTGSTVTTPDGDGVVVSNNILKESVNVRTENSEGATAVKSYKLTELKGFEAPADTEEEEVITEDIKELID